jgi:hypothetical protein
MLTKFKKFNVVGDEVIVIPCTVLDSNCGLSQFCEITASDNGDGEGTQLASLPRVAGEEDQGVDAPMLHARIQ